MIVPIVAIVEVVLVLSAEVVVCSLVSIVAGAFWLLHSVDLQSKHPLAFEQLFPHLFCCHHRTLGLEPARPVLLGCQHNRSTGIASFVD